MGAHSTSFALYFSKSKPQKVTYQEKGKPKNKERQVKLLGGHLKIRFRSNWFWRLAHWWYRPCILSSLSSHIIRKFQQSPSSKTNIQRPPSSQTSFSPTLSLLQYQSSTSTFKSLNLESRFCHWSSRVDTAGFLYLNTFYNISWALQWYTIDSTETYLTNIW